MTANLTPASRRQDHTISSYASGAFVKGAIRVHHTPLRVRDDREPPLCVERDGGNMGVIWVGLQVNNSEKQKYFLMGGWAGHIGLIRLDKFPMPSPAAVSFKIENSAR